METKWNLGYLEAGEKTRLEETEIEVEEQIRENREPKTERK